MRGALGDFRAASPSRARACAPATCPTLSMCPSPRQVAASTLQWLRCHDAPYMLFERLLLDMLSEAVQPGTKKQVKC